MTNPDAMDGSDIELVLLVSIASVKEKLPLDATCLLYQGDHPFIKQKSYVNYHRARIEPVSVLQNGARAGTFAPAGMLDTEVFARVCKGLLESRFTAPKFLRFYASATGEEA